MTKIHCDICDKELNDNDFISCKIPLFKTYDVKGGIGDVVIAKAQRLEMCDQDLCEECAIKLNRSYRLLNYIDY